MLHSTAFSPRSFIPIQRRPLHRGERGIRHPTQAWVVHHSCMHAGLATTRGQTRPLCLTLPHPETMTDTNAPITDVFLEGEGALPRINRQDETDLPTQEGKPSARYVIVEPFMLGTIPEVHAHRFLKQQECSRSKTFSPPCVSEERPWDLTGTHVYARDAGSAPARWPHSLSGSLDDFAFRSGRQKGRMRRPGSGVSQRLELRHCLDHIPPNLEVGRCSCTLIAS